MPVPPGSGQCTCYGASNPFCEVHGQKLAATPLPIRKPDFCFSEKDAQIVPIQPADLNTRAYNDLVIRLRALYQEMLANGDKPDALVLIAVVHEGENQNIYSPIILSQSNGDDIRDVLPSILDTVANSIRKATTQ